jgi:glycosyltransferase involved in cell wall biosynthesis
MKILMAHDRYRQRGGEDEVYDAETSLLESRGHTVIRHIVHNDSIEEGRGLRLAADTVWNPASRREVRDLIRRERPDLAHFYNTFPLLSPSIYAACREENVPVVQSLHNYRLMCANATFFRSGRPCEDCLGKAVPLDAVVHKCYRGKRGASAAVVAMQVAHRGLGTWSTQVDLYLAGVTEFARDKFVRGGIPAGKIVLKPNFVLPDPGPGTGRGGYALFIGRLTPEKGVQVLVDAWAKIGDRVPLRIVGDGALSSVVEEAAKRPGISWLGRRPLAEVHALLKDASFLVFPSIWYEALPRTIVDSLAVGTPILASKLGAMGDLVVDGVNGRHFRPDDAADLADKALQLANDPAARARLRAGARADYERQYTADRNYDMIMSAYRRVLPGKTA